MPTPWNERRHRAHAALMEAQRAWREVQNERPKLYRHSLSSTPRMRRGAVDDDVLAQINDTGYIEIVGSAITEHEARALAGWIIDVCGPALSDPAASSTAPTRRIVVPVPDANTAEADRFLHPR